MIRNRLVLATLLAGSAFSPALAQQVEAALSAEQSVAAAVVTPVAMADQENRRGDRRGGGDRAERIDRGDIAQQPNQERRGGWQQRERAPQAVQEQQPQAAPVAQAQPDWSARRNARGSDNGWQGRQAPVMTAPNAPVAQAETRGEWRGGRTRGGDNGSVNTSPAQSGGNVATWNQNRGWNRSNDRDRDGTPNWRDRDRDNDGIRNNRDRDRDNDGVRNNRDWDRNNDGRVDRRWDQNRNGTVDRRYDRNGNGVRDRNWGNNNGWNNGNGWNRDWRNDRRYDWQRYRYSNRNIFRQPRYYAPYGYGYQRFGIGIYLDNVLFGSRYRISDPWQYRLPEARWPYEWVRYYDDVLLVDTRTGYVVDVINDFFW
jgi:Nickel/cobalt transporter regulator